MEQSPDIAKLWQQYRQGKCTRKEYEQLMDWLQDPVNETEAKALMEVHGKEVREAGPMIASGTDQAFQKVWCTIQGDHPKKKVAFSPVFIRMAASIALVLGVSWIFFQYQADLKGLWTSATYRTVTTQGGQQATVKLEDGTVIKLNESSKLSYPQHFSSGTQREVVLEGEAFFEVAKNLERPFVVSVQEARIKVLGTAFNVKENRHDSTLYVAVKEGKVSLAYQSKQEQAQILTANDLGRLNKEGIEKHRMNDIANYLSWYSRRLVFEETVLPAVVQQLENIYEVKIELQSPQLREMVLTMDVPRRAIDKVLEDIANSLNLKVSQKGSQYVLEGA